MCSNFQPIKNHHADWVKKQFNCDLPNGEWRDEAYPTYPAPFIYLDNGQPRCELAQFGLVPHWATDKKKFGLKPITLGLRQYTRNQVIVVHGKSADSV